MINIGFTEYQIYYIKLDKGDCIMNWISINIDPTESGWYLVGHRGHTERIFFMMPPETEKRINYIVGWSKEPRRFGATHWAKIDDVPETEERSLFSRKIIGSPVRSRAFCVGVVRKNVIKKTFFRTNETYVFNKMDVPKGLNGTIVGYDFAANEITVKFTVGAFSEETVVFSEDTGFRFDIL